MRKFASVIFTLVIAASVMVSAPANAATKISNGVACTKLNATTTVSGSKYKCAKNPLTTSKKLTWLSAECLSTASLYLANKKSLPAVKAAADSKVAEIDVDLKKTQADLATHLATAPVKIAALQKQITEWQAKLAAAKLEVPVNQKTVKAWELAISRNQETIADLGPTGKLKTQFDKAIARLNTYRSIATSQYVSVNNDLKSALGMANMVCAKGF